MKDSGFRIRVQRDLRQQFLDACRAEDKPAAQVMREFMRDYVEHRGSADRPDRSAGGVRHVRPEAMRQKELDQE